MKIQSFPRTIILFAALTVTGICLIVLAPGIPDAAAKSALPLVGSSIFSAGLAYFLVKLA